MKITGIKTYVLQASIDDDAFGWSQQVTDRRQAVICLISADEEIQGVGEAFYFGGPARIAADIITHVYGPLLMDKDPWDTSVIWDSLYNRTRDQGMKGVVISALSAIDIALVPHVWGTNVGLAASLQLFASLPHFPKRRFPAEPFFEYDRSAHPFREKITVEKFVLKDGYLDIPDKPGLGISLDLKSVEKYAR